MVHCTYSSPYAKRIWAGPDATATPDRPRMSMSDPTYTPLSHHPRPNHGPVLTTLLTLSASLPSLSHPLPAAPWPAPEADSTMSLTPSIGTRSSKRNPASSPDDEQLAVRIALRRSRMDRDGSSSSAPSPGGLAGRLKLCAQPRRPVAVGAHHLRPLL